jgi:hypothetical protein
MKRTVLVLGFLVMLAAALVGCAQVSPSSQSPTSSPSAVASVGLGRICFGTPALTRCEEATSSSFRPADEIRFLVADYPINRDLYIHLRLARVEAAANTVVSEFDIQAFADPVPGNLPMASTWVGSGAPGAYHLEAFIDGNLVAVGSFTIAVP